MAVIRKILNALCSGVEWIAASPWLSSGTIFLLAFWTRYEQIKNIPSQYLVPTNNMELESIAISLFRGDGFADPYMMPTGPTAHLPPIYPFLLSFIYRWFGLTDTAGRASWLFVIACGALLYALLPWFAERLGLGRTAGFLGGLGAALIVDWAGHGEYLTGIALGLILIAFLRRWSGSGPSWGHSVLLGVGIGAAFHLQPALLPVVLGCLVFELVWRRRVPKSWIQSGALALGITLACIPWGWRNYATFGSIFFIRSNFGLELRLGNRDGTAATWETMDLENEPPHPRTHFAEARLLREVGEGEYMRIARDEALAWVGANPEKSLRLAAERFINIWAGPVNRPRDMLPVFALTLLAVVGAVRSFPHLSPPQRAVFLIPLLTFPLIYYFVAYMPRYRVPIDWILYMLAGHAVWSLIPQTPENNPGVPSSKKSSP